MRLAIFGENRLGVVGGTTLVDVTSALPEHDLLFLGRDLRHPRVVDAWLGAIAEGWIDSLVAEDEDGAGLVGTAALTKLARCTPTTALIASMAKAMHTAEIGPRPRLEPRSEKSRQRTPRMTVPPEARIGSHDCFSATRMAVYFDFSRRSSSRYRATSSRP